MKRFLLGLFVLILVLFLIAPVVFAQGVMKEYRGVRLGLSADEVHKLLGKPRVTSPDGAEDYVLNDENSVAIYYDANKTVNKIVLDFTGEKAAPDWKEVVGNAKVEDAGSGIKLAKYSSDEEQFSVTMWQKVGATVRTIITINKK